MTSLSTSLRYALARRLLGLKAAKLPQLIGYQGWQARGWADLSFDRLTREGYLANAAVHACVAALVFACQQPRPMVEQLDGEPLPDHPLQSLLERPNPVMSWSELVIYTTTYKAIGGNAYLHKIRGPGGRTVELWPYHIGHLDPVPDAANWIRGYRYAPDTADEKFIPARDIVHLKWPAVDPTQPWLALAPLRAIAREVDTDTEATRYLFALLANDAAPRTVVTVKDELSDTAYDRFMAYWQSRHARDNRGGVALIEGEGAAITRMGLDLQELAFDAIRRVPEARICAAFRVPAIIAGLTVGLDSSTYSNTEQARRMFTEDTVMQLLALDAAELTADLAAEYGTVRITHDYRDIVALHENETEVYARAVSAYDANLLTRNEARQLLGLPPLHALPPPQAGDDFKSDSQPPEPEPMALDRVQLRMLARKALQQTSIEDDEQRLARDLTRYFREQYSIAARAVQES